MRLILALAVVGVAIGIRPTAQAGELPVWTKAVLDREFRGEGVAIADVNRDGKPDVLAGECWYEAPTWNRHVIRRANPFDPKAYSESFAVFADDINHDGWVDQIVIGFPGKPCHWMENPKGEDRPWATHEIWPSACNETVLFVDLFGDGVRRLVMGWQPPGKEHEGQLAWFSPGSEPTKRWTMHAISEPSTPEREIPGTFKFYHGLGAGDINGDGRTDVLCRHGWWEQPVGAKQGDQPWNWHPASLGEDCSNMIVLDCDGDRRADIITSSAHRYGIWKFQQRGDPAKPAFEKQDLFPKLFSQSHALESADLDGDGVPDLITGKRWWAHGPSGDPEPNNPAVLYWFRGVRSNDGQMRWEPNLIDNDSGIGTQFAVADINGDGKPDIAVANKKGVFVFVRRKGTD